MLISATLLFGELIYVCVYVCRCVRAVVYMRVFGCVCNTSLHMSSLVPVTEVIVHQNEAVMKSKNSSWQKLGPASIRCCI